MVPEFIPESQHTPQLDPTLDVPAVPTATIRIVTENAEAHCHFWVGITEAGDIPPSNLLDTKSMGDLLTKARRQGVTEDGAIALSDTNRSPERFALLIPGPESNRMVLQWAEKTAGDLLAWNPKTLGLYFAPTSNNTQEPLMYLITLVRTILVINPTLPIFLLAGEYGLNRILNITLKLRDELDPSELALHVLH